MHGNGGEAALLEDNPQEMSCDDQEGIAENQPSNRPEEADEFPVVSNLGGDYSLAPSLILGHGTFSRVYQGTNLASNENVAIKAILIGKDNSLFQNEVKINSLVQGSSSIVVFRNSLIVEGIGYLIHDLCSLGEVFHHIVPQTGFDQRELIGPIFAQLLEAVTFLHTRGVCHLDIKPENMLLDRPGHMRLGDFGLSALVEDGPIYGCRGSISYAAPENLRSGSSGCVGYDGLRADVWSCGIVLFVMLYGITPWDVAADTCAEYRAYRVSDGFPNSRPWNRLSTAIRSIFHRTLCIVPNRRSVVSALKLHVARDCGWHAEPSSLGTVR